METHEIKPCPTCHRAAVEVWHMLTLLPWRKRLTWLAWLLPPAAAWSAVVAAIAYWTFQAAMPAYFLHMQGFPTQISLLVLIPTWQEALIFLLLLALTILLDHRCLGRAIRPYLIQPAGPQPQSDAAEEDQPKPEESKFESVRRAAQSPKPKRFPRLRRWLRRQKLTIELWLWFLLPMLPLYAVLLVPIALYLCNICASAYTLYTDGTNPLPAAMHWMHSAVHTLGFLLLLFGISLRLIATNWRLAAEADR